jgi:hypothetical protein
MTVRALADHPVKSGASPLRSAKQLGSEGSRHRAMLAHRFLVESLHGRVCGRERTLDTVNKIVYQRLVKRELAVCSKFDQERT